MRKIKETLRQYKECYKDPMFQLMMFSLLVVTLVLTAMWRKGTTGAETAEPTVHYCNLEYDDGEGLSEFCPELTAEGECQFKAGGHYEIYFIFPPAMIAELRTDTGHYTGTISYESHVAAGDYGLVKIAIENKETNQTYIGFSSFGADDDIYLGHSVAITPAGTATIDLGAFADNEIPTHLEFVLKTSAEESARHSTLFGDEWGTWYFEADDDIIL